MISPQTFIMPTTPPSPDEFRNACSRFATGVTVATVERAPGKVHGMTANSVTSVSLDPLLILICVYQGAHFLPMVKEKKRFGVNVLKEEHQDISKYFARPDEDAETEAKLGIRYRWTPSGIPLLEGALVHLACTVAASYVAGDHTIFIGEVESVEVFEGAPLLYFQKKYRRLAL
jgi:flavin reductase (DIM6/NTAB) family NADH-FMN oxidoreductase RutF